MILARMKWHRLSVTRVRTCKTCAKEFASTSSGERTCCPCEKLGAASRARTAALNPEKQYRDDIHGIFDSDILIKQHDARIFDRIRRCQKRLRFARNGDAEVIRAELIKLSSLITTAKDAPNA